MFGLKSEELEQIENILNSQNIHYAKIFGSRAKGNYKAGSDVDIAIDGDEKKVSYLLNEESDLIYFFDVLNIHKITNTNLQEHIKRVGKDLIT